MEQSLGRFGDRRLQKGGCFFWDVLSRRVRAASVCAPWVAIGPVRSGLGGSCATRV
jgi:hypothetical protein